MPVYQQVSQNLFYSKQRMKSMLPKSSEHHDHQLQLKPKNETVLPLKQGELQKLSGLLLFLCMTMNYCLRIDDEQLNPK